MRSRPPRTDSAQRGPKPGPRGADRPAGEAGALGRFRSPLYHQIYLIMRQRIADGEFGTGGTLPSEQELAEYHGVSRITAKRALDELANDGLVVRERGRGTRVVEGRTGVRISGQGTGAFDPLLAMGGETEVAVKEFGYGAAENDVAAALGLPVGTIVQRAVRVRSLGVDVGAPLLRIRRVVRDRNGKAIELLVALYRSDLYRLTMTLSRGLDADGVWSADAVTGTPSAAVGTWRAVRDAGTEGE